MGYYSAELSQKIRRGLHENRVKGYYSGGIIPYGYYVEKKKFISKKTRLRLSGKSFNTTPKGLP